jgi:hypothetical protein
MTYLINSNISDRIYVFENTKTSSKLVHLCDRSGKKLHTWVVSAAEGNYNFKNLISKGWKVFDAMKARKAKAKKETEILKAQDREMGMISMATASLYTPEEIEAFNNDPEVIANREAYFADI